MRNIFSAWFGSSSTKNEKGFQSSAPRVKAFTRSKKPSIDQAMQLSAFWSGVDRWSKTISSLPVEIQNKAVDAEGNVSWTYDEQSDLNILFAGKVNRYQIATEFFKEMAFNLFANGNCFALITRVGGRIKSLLPLSSTQIEIKLLDNGDKVYIYTHDNNKTVLAADSVWHLMLFGNNVMGMSPLTYGANSIGVGLSADERTTQVFDNAAKPSGILTFDSKLKLTDKQREQLKKEFADLKEGTDNVLMTLESGWSYEQIGLNPSDIQLLESRRFTIEDIGRFLDVPPILLYDTSGTSSWGSGITEIVDGWYKLSLKPMTKYIALSMQIHLTAQSKRKNQRVFFGFDELLQLSRKERVEANAKEINSAQMTPNEGRASENRPPKKNGDELLINSALVPIDGHMLEHRLPKETQNED